MFTIKSIGTVFNERKEIRDDHWGSVQSIIRLGDDWDESCLDGIEAYSHLEIFYIFHLVGEENIQYTSRHPRNNDAWPKVGIFAQRAKNRPNRLGATIVSLIKRECRILYVSGLDAIDGTPVIDIKPVLNEFLPRENVRQPEWATELMAHYWK